jgi:hypothetical protein
MKKDEIENAINRKMDDSMKAALSEDFEQEWAKNPEIIRQPLTDKGYRLPENPILEFKFFTGANNILHYGFKEIQSQYFFSIGLVN